MAAVAGSRHARVCPPAPALVERGAVTAAARPTHAGIYRSPQKAPPVGFTTRVKLEVGGAGNGGRNARGWHAKVAGGPTGTPSAQGAGLAGGPDSGRCGQGVDGANSGGPHSDPDAARRNGEECDKSADAAHLELRGEYKMGDGDCTCDGIAVHANGFHEYLWERVDPRRTDAEGILMVKKALDGLESTGFGISALGHLAEPARMPDDYWRAGESLTECYLEDYEGATFPHQRLRDERNPYASPAGPDLVGYAVHGGDVMFLFGEAKTTGEATRPPRVMQDLRYQLDSLLSGRGVTHLVQYLIKKAQAGADEQDRERSDKALKSYAEHKWKTVGVLISDQTPSQVDLEATFARLEKTAGSNGKILRLVALYVPVPVASLGRPASGGDAA